MYGNRLGKLLDYLRFLVHMQFCLLRLARCPVGIKWSWKVCGGNIVELSCGAVMCVVLGGKPGRAVGEEEGEGPSVLQRC